MLIVITSLIYYRKIVFFAPPYFIHDKSHIVNLFNPVRIVYNSIGIYVYGEEFFDMDHRFLKRYRSVCRVLLTALIMMLIFTSFCFANDGAAVYAADGAETAQAADPSARDFSHEISYLDVEKYGYYQGRNATRIPIITYHQIVTDAEKKSKAYRRDQWVIGESAFYRQMAWLKSKGYRTINCDEFFLWYHGYIKLPKRSVLITFDDANANALERSAPLFAQYGFKGTYFLIGAPVHAGGTERYVSEARVRELREMYPNLEFQSHTYNLHWKGSTKVGYAGFYQDAMTQKEVFNFDYIAYPYGAKNNAMIRAYKDAGLRMAFSFGDYGFATRKQNAFKIKRLGVKASTSFRQFKRWCN